MDNLYIWIEPLNRNENETIISFKEIIRIWDHFWKDIKYDI